MTESKEVMKGYLYVPASEAAPMLVYARSLHTVAMAIAVAADSLRAPERAEAVRKAAAGKAPGLYHARVVLDPGGPAVPRPGGIRVRFKVTCARRVKAGPAEEVAVLTARVKARRKPGKRQDPRRMRSAREARALVDGLRGHVMPLTWRAEVAL